MPVQDVRIWTGTEWVSMQGPPGDAGDAATVSVVSTTTGAPGTNASVTDRDPSNPNNLELEFVIPEGEKGGDGDPGDAATLDAGNVTTNTLGPGSNAAVTVTNTGTTSDAVFDFRFDIPKGDKGADGSGVTIIGSIGVPGPPTSQFPSAGQGDMVIDSNGDGWVYDGSNWTNVGPIRGPEGDKGDQSTVSVRTPTIVTTVPNNPDGSAGTATASAADMEAGDPHNADIQFTFGIPAGAKGDAGDNAEVYVQSAAPTPKGPGAMWIVP